MRYLLQEKRWTDKGRVCLVGVESAFFLLKSIISNTTVMMSHIHVNTMHTLEIEKEVRSSMEIVIIESPPFIHVVCIKSRRASLNKSLQSILV